MAVKVTRTFTATQRGIGKPDYTREVSSAIERAGLELKYNETLKNFFVIFTSTSSPFAWFKDPLDPEETGHLVDAVTGDDMPFTIPQGYIISLIQDSFGFTEDSEAWVAYETYPIALLSVSGSGLEVYRNRVSPFTSSLVDPTGASSHPLDVTVKNKGGGNLEGSFAISAILKAVGTEPLPTIKRVKCKHCGHKWDVPVETTELICPECGKLTMVYNLADFRGTP